MTDLHWMTLAEASRSISLGRLSPVELTDALIDRAERLDPRLHAFVRLDRDGARSAARAAEADLRAGRVRGPLHGIPAGIKDIIDVAGLPTTCQSRLSDGRAAAEDAHAVARLRAAGAIVLGKLTTHEFAIGGPSFDLPWPPARNPWNTDHHPGGSSSGSGVAVAAGLVPMALGTDTAGSVRHPAGACGIVGLKPTYGLVSRHGVAPLAATLDHVGPMTRTVEDNALLLDVMAGHDPRDPGSVRASVRPSGRLLQDGVRGVRIGYLRQFQEEDIVAHPEVAAIMETVVGTLAAEGAEIRDVRLPPLAGMAAATMAINHAHAWAIHAGRLGARPQDYGALARQRLMIGAFLSAEDLVRAQHLRAEYTAAVEVALGEVDVMLSAGLMDPPCRIDDAAALAHTHPRQARAPFALTGHPALVMMAGLSTGGLPLSLQIIGRYFDEANVYRVARAWERVAGTDRMHPPLLDAG